MVKKLIGRLDANKEDFNAEDIDVVFFVVSMTLPIASLIKIDFKILHVLK